MGESCYSQAPGGRLVRNGPSGPYGRDRLVYRVTVAMSMLSAMCASSYLPLGPAWARGMPWRIVTSHAADQDESVFCGAGGEVLVTEQRDSRQIDGPALLEDVAWTQGPAGRSDACQDCSPTSFGGPWCAAWALLFIVMSLVLHESRSAGTIFAGGALVALVRPVLHVALLCPARPSPAGRWAAGAPFRGEGFDLAVLSAVFQAGAFVMHLIDPWALMGTIPTSTTTRTRTRTSTTTAAAATTRHTPFAPHARLGSKFAILHPRTSHARYSTLARPAPPAKLAPVATLHATSHPATAAAGTHRHHATRVWAAGNDHTPEQTSPSPASGPSVATQSRVRLPAFIRRSIPSRRLSAILAIYIVQGLQALSRLAVTFRLKDMGLTPAAVGSLTGFTLLPWILKPLYGFLSDGVPIFGYRRRSYLILSGLVGFLGYGGLATIAHTPFLVLVCTTMGTLSIAMSDVVVDSIVVEDSRDMCDGDKMGTAGDLQSAAWTAFSFGGLLSAYYSGSLLEALGPVPVFAITAVMPLMVALLAFGIDETPVRNENMTGAQRRSKFRGQFNELWGALSNKRVYLPMLFMFLWIATPTYESTFLYFLSNDLGFGPKFLGRLRLAEGAAQLAGIAIFRTFLRRTAIRSVLLGTAVLSVPLGLLQVMLASHANRALGIPDKVLCFGDDVMLTALRQVAFMPQQVLAALLCPPGVEATLFATLMSIYNLAIIVGTQTGAALTSWFNVTDTNFTNFPVMLTVCTFSRLLPLLCIGLLREVDDVTDETAQSAGSSAGGRSASDGRDSSSASPPASAALG